MYAPCCMCTPTHAHAPAFHILPNFAPPPLPRTSVYLCGWPQVDDGTPLPPWLKDRRYLNPLLTSYDNHMGELEAKAKEASAALEQLQKQVGGVGRGHACCAVRL